ncbi:hypothetical protein ACYOEI_11875 [Singulisphaera rosea]
MARWITRKHLASDSSIRVALYLPTGAPADEIRLLGVNDRLTLSEAERRNVEPIEFGLNVQGAPFRLFVADITSERLEAISASRLPLPHGWEFVANIATGRRT